MAKGTGHPKFYYTRGIKGSAGADGIGRLGMQETVQPILIDLRDTEEFDSELAVFAPSNRRRLDCDRRPQVGGSNKEPDR